MGGNGFLFLGTVYVDKLWGNFHSCIHKLTQEMCWNQCVFLCLIYFWLLVTGSEYSSEHFICYKVFLFWTCLVGILWLYMHYLPCIILGQYYICWVGTIETQTRYKNWYLLVFIFVIVLVVIVSKGEKIFCYSRAWA